MRQRQALQVMLSGASVFLTGPPGAGKTYVLNEFIRRATKAGKNVAVTASTGIAATHIGGMTIHSWSGLGVKEFLSDWDRDRLESTERLVKRYNGADVLVIDEVSMLHGKRLDLVNEVCKILRKNQAPFGGLQVVLVGDLFQLPPVSRGGEMVDFAHMSAAWQELAPQICYLTEQHRQQDDGLLDILNAMRRGEVDHFHEELLRERLESKPAEDEPVTRLFTHNVDVESINQDHLAALDSDAKIYEMESRGAAAKVEQLMKTLLAPERLELKKNAEVMFVANNFGAGFVNGTRGRVVGFKDGSPMVELLSNARIVKVEPHTWALEEDGKKRAEIMQLPLRLAWAITIHKSQGMSLDAAEIDLSRSFTPGMGYVALSRVRSIDGVYLKGINNLALAMHPQIFAFDNELQTASDFLAEGIEDLPDEPAVSEDINGDGIVDVAAEYDEELFEKLRAWRSEQSRSQSIAPFMVAHDAALKELARVRPVDAQRLLGVKGFGPKKIEQYGEGIVQLVRSHVGEPEPAVTPVGTLVSPIPPAIEPAVGNEVSIVYMNWRGKLTERTIQPLNIWFGSTEWHKEPQWFLKAMDIAKESERDFALKDIQRWVG
jgi:GTPase SAR1 family protein